MESLLMNLFFVGQLRAMGPKFVTEDGKNTVIRPLVPDRGAPHLPLRPGDEFSHYGQVPVFRARVD